MPVVRILNEADPRIADYRNVPDAVLLEERRLFVAEGRLVVRRLLTESRLQTRSVLVTEAGFTALADVLSEDEFIPIYIVPQAVMNGVTGFNIHRGCLALGVRPSPVPLDPLIATARRLVVLERVANADNVGGVFRNAAAFASDGIVLDTRSTDPLYRKAIRTSMGTALKVPFTRTDAWPAALETIREAGVTVIALTPDAGAEPITEVARRVRQDRVALLLGHEGDGLTDVALACADVRGRIPMATAVDSINVATAAAVALYELARG